MKDCKNYLGLIAFQYFRDKVQSSKNLNFKLQNDAKTLHEQYTLKTWT